VVGINFQDLSNWKSKMRRKSQAAHQRALQMDEIDKEQEEEREEGAMKRTKPFSSMVQDRLVFVSLYLL
jgi:hypothetical protein